MCVVCNALVDYARPSRDTPEPLYFRTTIDDDICVTVRGYGTTRGVYVLDLVVGIYTGITESTSTPSVKSPSNVNTRLHTRGV